jgi:hypothetical protein
MLLKKKEKQPNEFWVDYEKKTGEKVITRALGKYISGWDEFDKVKTDGMWGLIINTSGGFRFHHFPKHTWIDAFTLFAEAATKKEKTIFIPEDKILSREFIKEARWWVRIFVSSSPMYVIRYLEDDETEKKLLFEAEFVHNRVEYINI